CTYTVHLAVSVTCDLDSVYCIDSSIQRTPYPKHHTPSLHDALPIYTYGCQQNEADSELLRGMLCEMGYEIVHDGDNADLILINRSEEHTSELQSRFELVCRLLLEKKKNKIHFTVEAKTVVKLIMYCN